MVKILLITPQRNLRRPKTQYLSIPTNIASLGGFLQINGYMVEVIDTPIEGYKTWELQPNGIYKCGLSDEELKKRIIKSNPDIVGISCHFTARANNVINIAKLVKSIKNIPVIIGGMHATVCAEQMLRNPEIDFVVLGEGELPTLNLLNKLVKQETDFDKLQGIGCRTDNNICVSNDRVLVDDLNAFPVPAYELLPMEKYFSISPGRDAMTTEKRYASVITSRGCPHQCTFCSSHNLWGDKWRFRSVPHIMYELDILVNTYKVKEISFEDDNLTLDPNRIGHLCKEIIHRNLKFKWNTPNGVSVLQMNRDLLRLMKQSGCTRLNFGIESGDEKILKLMNKNLPLDKIKEVITMAHEEGIITTGYFVLGIPGETVESMERSLAFAKSLSLDEIGLNIAVPYPQTVLEKSAKENGYLKIDAGQLVAEDDIGDTIFIETPMLSKEQLSLFKKHFFKDFYKTRIKHNPLYYAKRALKNPKMIGRLLC